jgi:hypothetical protein
MADVKISALPASTTPLDGTEVLPIVQSGVTKQVSVANLTAGRSITGSSFIPSSSTIPTNGVYLPAANTVGIATASTTALSINATQQVGIGVDPTYKLQVQAAGSGAVVSLARFGVSGNGGSGRGTGILIGASGSTNSVDVAQIVGYQNAAAATATSAALAFQVANTGGTLTEVARMFNSGGVSVGNTTDPGATNLSVTGKVTGLSFNSITGITASTATAVAVTMFASASEACYIVNAYLFGTSAPASFNAVAIVKSSGGVAAVTTISTATSMTITVSGLNVQATQVSGAPQSINYAVTRLY